MTDNSKQTKPYNPRAGFPVSSSRYNDIFDAMTYDIINMLTQNIAEVEDMFKQATVALSEIEALAFKPFYKDLDHVKLDHTDNWRKL